MKLDLALY